MLIHKPLILIIEDDEDTVFGYQSFLSDSGYDIIAAPSLQEATQNVESHSFDAILLDLKLPDGNALNWIPKIKESQPHLPIIVITGVHDIPTAVQATKNGAENFLTKPLELEVLKRSLDNCLELERLKRKNILQQQMSEREKPYFGLSSAIKGVLDLAKLAAANNSVIFLQGETGSGKGVLAKWIHQNSQRHTGNFVELNCTCLNGDLLQSELFGHTKGAFTSAVKNREGLIEAADGGTLFLDEIGDMAPTVQAQMLKTIEEKSFRRMGENRVRNSNFRLICASNADLMEKIKQKKFRSDLYYRLCVFPITIPPLRSRTEDIPGLVTHILKGFGYSYFPLSQQIISVLKSYSWQGNVRELRNMLERAILLAGGEAIQLHHFPGLSNITVTQSKHLPAEKLSEIEDAHILTIISKYDGDKLKASQALGMSLSNLYRKLNRINQTI